MKRKLILLSALVALVSCTSHQDKQPETRPIDVRVMAAGVGHDASSHSYAGRIEAKASRPLSVQTSGRILEMTVREGEYVKAGQLLLRVDNTQQQNALEAAKAVLHQAEDAYQRVEKVHESGVVSELQWVEVQTKLNEARATVETAEHMVRQCELRAPADGIIGQCYVEVGQSVLPVQPLLELLNVSEYYVRFGVPETEIAGVNIGDKGVLRVKAIGEEDIPVTIIERSMNANTLAHTYNVLARLQRKDAVLPGMIGDVTLRAQEVDGLIVPTECIQLMRTQPTVWVARDSVAVRCPVRLGEYVNSGVVVDSGLQAGDRIIIEGFQKLYNNAKIHY